MRANGMMIVFLGVSHFIHRSFVTVWQAYVITVRSQTVPSGSVKGVGCIFDTFLYIKNNKYYIAYSYKRLIMKIYIRFSTNFACAGLCAMICYTNRNVVFGESIGKEMNMWSPRAKGESV